MALFISLSLTSVQRDNVHRLKEDLNQKSLRFQKIQIVFYVTYKLSTQRAD